MSDRYGTRNRKSRRSMTPTFYDDHSEDYSYADKKSRWRKPSVGGSSDWESSGIAAKSTNDESRDDTSYGYRSRESDLLHPPRMSSTVSSWYSSSVSDDRKKLDSVGMKNTLGQAKQYLANPDDSEGKVRLKKRLLKELDAYRNELKAQLVLFNDNFTDRHGRAPTRKEKEPIRHLYEVYHSFKKEMQNLKEQDDEDFCHVDIASIQEEGKQTIQMPLQSPPPTAKKGGMFGKMSRSKSPSPLKRRPSVEEKEIQQSNGREKNSAASEKPKRSSSPLSFFGRNSGPDADRKSSKSSRKKSSSKRAPSPKPNALLEEQRQEAERAISPTNSKRGPSPRPFRRPSFDFGQEFLQRSSSPTPSMRSNRSSRSNRAPSPSHINESERNQMAKRAVSPTNSRRSASSFLGRRKNTENRKRAESPTARFFDRMKNGGKQSHGARRVVSPTNSARSASSNKSFGKDVNEKKMPTYVNTNRSNDIGETRNPTSDASPEAFEKKTTNPEPEEVLDNIQFAGSRDYGKPRFRYPSPPKLRKKKPSSPTPNKDDPDWCDAPRRNTRPGSQKSKKERGKAGEWANNSEPMKSYFGDIEVGTDDPENTLVERIPVGCIGANNVCTSKSRRKNEDVIGTGGCMFELESLVPKLLGMHQEDGAGVPKDDKARYTAAKEVASKLMDEIKKESARLGLPESKLLAAIQDGGGSLEQPSSPRRAVKSNKNNMRSLRGDPNRRTRSKSRQKDPIAENTEDDWGRPVAPMKIQEIAFNENKSMGDVSSVTGTFF